MINLKDINVFSIIKNLAAPKILKFDHCYLIFQKKLPHFFKIKTNNSDVINPKDINVFSIIKNLAASKILIFDCYYLKFKKILPHFFKTMPEVLLFSGPNYGLDPL